MNVKTAQRLRRRTDYDCVTYKLIDLLISSVGAIPTIYLQACLADLSFTSVPRQLFLSPNQSLLYF